MSIISIPYTFSPGATIIASQHNSNFSTIYNDYNGNITTSNLSASAGILYSQLSLTNGIQNSDINSSAAIAGTKIVSIAGTQLTGNIPANILAMGTATSAYYLGITGTAIPTWQLVNPIYSLVSTTTVTATTSSGAITIVGSNYYKVIVIGKDVSGSTNGMRFIFNADSGSNYNYGYSGRGSSNVIGASSAGDSIIGTSAGVVGNGGFTIEANLSPYNVSVNDEAINGTIYGDLVTAGYGFSNFGGVYLGSSSIISFTVNGGGNWTGTVYLYQIVL